MGGGSIVHTPPALAISNIRDRQAFMWCRQDSNVMHAQLAGYHMAIRHWQAGKASVQHEDRQLSGHYLPVQTNEQQCYVSRAVTRAGILSSNPLLFFPLSLFSLLWSISSCCVPSIIISPHSRSVTLKLSIPLPIFGCGLRARVQFWQ